ncbi:hypothetical protein O9G_002156 [Rozella allomycis CSF55]|uniref:WD40 repeat-containing protein SMU1 n=2 Tax=Rozella allomycis (strain CSF55) TaxID=988480 RepID=A0A075AQ88_ROZAC|nr:hypothetical protein O9G_002156 [Rozella allomycis CSF55]|eukprot:EPZ32315.1 hypothetical protein O9G_002156 [Rozella allomycis CSF55]
MDKEIQTDNNLLFPRKMKDSKEKIEQLRPSFTDFDKVVDLDEFEYINFDDPSIKLEVIRLICQYLQDEGYTISKTIICDETNVKLKEYDDKANILQKLKRYIVEGDWIEVEKCIGKIGFDQKVLLFEIYKQQYLELIESREIQKAFSFLLKKLKPFEHIDSTGNTFKDLCYLLTVKSIHEVQSFRHWEGVQQGREKLIEQINSSCLVPNAENDDSAESINLPKQRLKKLLNQAASYQFAQRMHQTEEPKPKISSSLFEDYCPRLIPNDCHSILKGENHPLKCVSYLGSHSEYLVAAGTSKFLYCWDLGTSCLISKVDAHESKIWDVCCHKDYIFTSSADSTVKVQPSHFFKQLFDIRQRKISHLSTFSLDSINSDIYTCHYHGFNNILASGGYEKKITLFDVKTNRLIKLFEGHEMAITKLSFNLAGNLVLSGSKDGTVKVFDTVSGLCVKTIDCHLGEVTSVRLDSNGIHMLTSSKDNSTRLWDFRMLRPLVKYKGHQTTSKNFVRSSFGNSKTIVSGSEKDGHVYIWDMNSAELLQRLPGHTGVVYDTIWSDKQSKLVSCGEDGNLMLWKFNPRTKDTFFI